MPTDQPRKGVSELAAEKHNELTPTSVAEWGKKKRTDDGFTTELPSGNIVKMRRTLDLPILLQTGRIPNPLASIVSGMIKAGTSEFPPEVQDLTAVKQLMELLDSTVVNCVIEPPFSRPEPRRKDESEEEYNARLEEWEPDEGTVSIFNMEIQDKMYVFSIAQGGAADLTRFREESEAAMGALEGRESVRKSAKRTSRAAGTGNREQRRAAAKKAAKR